MGKYTIKLENTANSDLKKLYKTGRKSDILKVERIIKELEETPYEGVGSPELLKHDLAGLWSRRINRKDRIIYRVKESIVTVLILSAKGHYGDK